ncbi:MAG: hydrolase [Planctomycetota bacterium]|nr:hydrolase [Planctomycetota bacterium]
MIAEDVLSVLQTLEKETPRMRELVEEVCNVNSWTTNVTGVNKVRAIFRAQFATFADQLSEPEMPDWEVVDAQGESATVPIAPALQVQMRPDARKKIFLCIHLDTVYPPDHELQECREIQPGLLNGPGVIDAKGGAVIMLFALQAFEKHAAAKNIGWEVILNTDEEIGSPSSGEFLKSRARGCELGLLFEPALPDGTLVDRRKGSANYSVIVRGISAHAGRDFEKGRNAIALAAKLASELHDLNAVHEEVTINVSKIDGGGPTNVVADLGIVRVNIRVGNQQQQEWVERELATKVDDYNSREGFSCQLHGAFFSPPKNLDARGQTLKSQIETSARDLGLDIGWRSTGGVSDGNKLAAIDVPNIDTLGARGDHMHNPREYLILDSLVERAKLTTLLMIRYATGEFALESPLPLEKEKE